MTTGIACSTCSIAAHRRRSTDLTGGQVQVMFDNLPSSIEHIRAGRLRALAVITPAPLDCFPDVPTVNELLPVRDQRVCRSRRTVRHAADIVDKLNARSTPPGRCQCQGAHPRSWWRADADGTRQFGRFLA